MNSLIKKSTSNGIRLKAVATDFDKYLLFLTMVSIVFVPSIKINDALFVGIDEVLVLLMGLRLLQEKIFWLDQMVMVFGLLGLIILFSILLNPNYKDYREYLELHKLLKFATLYLFSCWVSLQFLNEKKIIRFVNGLFLCLVVFNILHLFNLFYFNEFITILYDTDGRDVMNFGKNSLGGPGPKRIVGTMGNPNINSILFLLFFAFYSFLDIENRKETSVWKLASIWMVRIPFMFSMLFVILCQSRTGIVSLVVIYVFGIFIRKPNWKEVMMEVLCVFSFFGITAFLDTISLQYLTNTKPKLQENNSFAVRIKIWKYLIGSWLENPIFGYGPNKAFVYKTELHPENEYLFYLWRYGVQGVIAYISLLVIPFKSMFSKVKDFSFLYFTVIVIAMAASMNNPLSNPKISVLFAIIIGFSVAVFYNFKTEQGKNV